MMNSEAPGDPGALAFSYTEAAEKVREAGSKLMMVAPRGHDDEAAREAARMTGATTCTAEQAITEACRHAGGDASDYEDMPDRAAVALNPDRTVTIASVETRSA